ncbi:MAG TPA: transglycosylase SLT domain-containing protein [Thermoanaerobaculia bacterium]
MKLPLKLPRSRKTLVLGVAGVVALLIVIAIVVSLRKGAGDLGTDERVAAIPSEPEAPPDLQKFRDQFMAGVKAVDEKNGAEAVKQLSGFHFGSRAVEEYRLYYLAQAYELAKNGGAARATLAKLWRRNPKMVATPDALLKLGNLYSARGAFGNAAEVYASIPARSETAAMDATGRWHAIESRLFHGDISGALFAARNIAIHNPRAQQAPDARAIALALHGLGEKAALPLTPSERLQRAATLRISQDPQTALEELTAMASSAPASLQNDVRLQRGLALHSLRRYEDSIKELEPLTSGEYKLAIPALQTLSKNYRILSSAIDPTVYKTIKEKKQVGTIKQRVGKGKKRRTITKPKFQTVTRQIKLIDLAKKTKKENYERLTSERLKDLLQLPINDDQKLEVLNTLMARAQSKNQDSYVQELVPAIVKLDPLSDPALQYFWDRAWAMYTRGDLQGSRKLFRFVADTYTTNTNVRRQAEYWFARTSERLGQKEEAAAIYQKLASAPYADVYAMHAVNLRGAKRQPNTTNPLKAEKKEDWAEIAEKKMPAELRLAYELTALSNMRDARLELQRNAKRTNVRFAEALMADLYHSRGDLIPMYRSIRKAWPQLATVEQDQVPNYFIKMYYPMKYHDSIEKYSKQHGVDPHLVMGLILQESYYNPKAKSRVGATGLMQLMPPTAKELAAKLRIPFAVSRLENPDVNIRLGTRHLKMLIDMFNGNTYLAVASYNGGQGNVLKWRRANPGRPLDEFLESIPFPETRGYVKRVTLLKGTYERLVL